MRARGTGRVFRRWYVGPDGRKRQAETWSIAYYDRRARRKVREGTACKRQSEAEALLRRRLEDVGMRRPTGPQVERTTFEDLAALVVTDYLVNGKRSLLRIRQCLAHLRDQFGRDRAVDITEDRIAAYVRARLSEGGQNGTINRELATLKRAFRLGERALRVARRPYIALLREPAPRKGFFEPGEVTALLAALPEDLRPVVEVAHITGWRVQSEILTREWKHVDFGPPVWRCACGDSRNGDSCDACGDSKPGWLRLDPGETKNGEGRTFPLTPELRAVLVGQRERTEALERQTGRIIPSVFWRRRGPGVLREGVPVALFRRSWIRACAKAGLARRVLEARGRVVKVIPLRIPHDFRRTAVRNLERAGVPRPRP